MLREGIKHIEDLKPQQLLDFLSNWNIDKKNFHVSEKVDGNFFGFGLKEGQFYVRSKNKSWDNVEDISNLFFMQSFKDYYRLLEKVPLADIVAQLAPKYGFTFNGSIDIEGEAIPSYDHNIVIYDEKKIGNGIFVIFSTKIDGQNFNNPNFWIDLAEEMNKFTSVKVYAVPEVSLDRLEFDNALIVSLQGLIEKHGNFLKKPARTPEAKELKQQVYAAVKEIGMNAKQQALQTKFQSLFGDEYEGLVIASPTGELVKIVEKDKFTKRKVGNWHFIDMLIAAQNQFKKAVKADPESIKREIVKWSKELNRIEKDFIQNKDKHITIQKKARDTQQSIDLDQKVIKMMEDMLGEMSPEEVVDKFLKREIVPESKQLFEAQLPLKEGGNVWEEVNSAVPSALLDVNVAHALEAAGLKDLKFEPVGNINKEFLGDIDIAVDKSEMIQHYGFSEAEFWADLERKLTGDYKIIKGLKQFHLKSPLVGNDRQQLDAFSANGEQRKGEPGFIQIDVFVGNLGWMQSVVSGAPPDSKYKAVYRNLFLVALFSRIRWQSKATPGMYNKLTLNVRDGFTLVQKRTVPPSGKRTKPRDEKVSEKMFSVDPDVIAQVLFNKSVKWKDIESFEKLFALFNSDSFRFKNQREEILEVFKRDLIKRKKDIPSELE
jgi:hypothetical protein